MGRTSLVLAVVAAMVTVLVVAVPAFAVAPDRGASDPSGPPPNEDSGGPAGKDVDPQADAAPVDTLGGTASEIIVDDATVHGAPPGYHIMDFTHLTPGEVAQICMHPDDPRYPVLCT